MTVDDQEKLMEETRMLKILLDFHVQNKSYLSLSESEFEEYVNVILDRLNEINEILDHNK